MSQTLSPPATPAKAPTNGHTARRLATRSRLLQAGTELFAERGVGAVTTTTIAERAGVATGTFYLHFEDKHELFELLVQEAVREMGAKFDLDNLGRTDDAARRSALDDMMRVAEERRDLIRAVFDQGETADTGGSPTGSLAGRIQDRIAKRLEPIYAELFPQRGIVFDPGGSAQARAAVIVRMVAWWADEPSPTRRDAAVELMLDMDPLRIGESRPGREQRSRPTPRTDRYPEPRQTEP